MFEPLADLPNGVIGFEAVGEVTPDDFESVLLPAIEAAAKAGKIRLLFVLGERYTGFKAGVVWEKAKMRAEHIGAWERCALVTDIEWIERIVGLLHFMLPGNLKLFPLAELDGAKAWVAG
jgi:hypothetical protein